MRPRTLENLAKNCTAVFMDNCVMNLDQNYDLRRGNGEHDSNNRHQIKTDPSILTRIGAAKYFSEVKQSNLNSHASQTKRLQQIILKYKTIVTCPEIITEYTDFINALDCSLSYFKRKSNTKRAGKKEEKLKEIIDLHQTIYKAYRKRNRGRPQDYCSNILQKRRMHISHDDLFVKNYRHSNETSEGDAGLVGNALTTAFESPGEVAIVSRDLDVVNLLRSFAKHYDLGNLDSDLRGRKIKGSTTVYFPSKDSWVPNLNLEFVCDSKGHFIFFDSDSRRVIHYSELGKK